MLRPGLLTREFLAGKRQEYTPPLRLYLVVSISFFILIAWVASKGVLLDPGQTAEEFAEGQAEFLANELPRWMFVLLPLFALILKLAWFRRLYFDHIIFSLHVHSVAYIAIGLMMPIEQLANESMVLLVVQNILMAAFIGYFVIAARVVYGSGWYVTCLKSIAVLLGYIMAVSATIEMTSTMKLLAD